MKLYIPPQVLLRYWWLLRRHYADGAHGLSRRWTAFEGHWPRPNDRGIYFTACDSAYFDLYAENYVESIATAGGHQSIHLHIYDGSDAQMALANQMGRERGVAVTTTRDLSADPELNSAFLYAAGRFVILSSLLRESRSPVICTDVDVIVRGSLDADVAAMAGRDVSLFLRPGSSLPWRKVLASTVIACPTPAAEHYFGVVGSTLAEILQRPLDHHVDQIILLYAFERARSRKTAKTHFVPLAKRLIDWDFGEDALIWNAKGPQRKDAYWRIADQMRTESIGSLGK